MTHDDHWNSVVHHHKQGQLAKSKGQGGSASVHFRTRDKHLRHYVNKAPEHELRAKSAAIKQFSAVKEERATPTAASIATPIKVKRLLLKSLQNKIERKRQNKQTVKLPVDLSGPGGVFPQRDLPLHERIAECRQLRLILDDQKSSEVKRVTATVMRQLRGSMRR
jgi:hypothetical protein